MPRELLIDVRSPLEFSTGPLVSDLAPTVNIEYTSIDRLAEIYLQQGIEVDKNDSITLYCRSGRRSDIAMRRLRELGYANVRDIGGFEDAKRVLDKETVARQLESMAGEETLAVSGEEEEKTKKEKDDGKAEGRSKGFGALLEGLQECDA
ncbi:hypothetical protein EKO04_008170 [Ascochyta lentis]|uniref:Rhodanese domain-containing protein n=1 Tax=Ascochyta lentis TaxID=205686 RepID=A0A8H7IZM1_9PLEO|nr:hypothetical protein EKO04_008170 [Ascochyta lentis]